MSPKSDELKILFTKSCKCITALGDKTRQSIILALLESPCDGLRVGAITEKTHLSRPAVSHHLKVLCDANLLSVRKSCTMNFYRLNPDREAVGNLHNLCRGILEALDYLEDCGERNVG